MFDRLKVFKYIILAFFLLLILRAGHLQIVMGDYYHELSKGNRISLRPINAPRGKILDTNGKILVSNKISYNLYLLPNEIPPDIPVDKLLADVAALIDIDLEKLEAIYRETEENSRKKEAVLLQRNISQEMMVIIEENADQLPGILVKESSVRDYVYDSTASHIIGYVGEISINGLKNFNNEGYNNYDANDIVGKSGIEREYEAYLKGTDGVKQIEVNNIGEQIRTLGTNPPQPGNNLILNIDYDLQKRVEELLSQQLQKLREEADKDPEINKPTGAASIVMDLNTGAVRAMASAPDFNLNDFALGLTAESYSNLINDPLNPLLNRAIMAAVPPGSIFKLVTGTAAIEYLDVNADTEFVDKNGQFYIPHWSRPFNNWHEGGEGRLDFTRAIARSNNIVFYSLGYRLYEKYRGQKLTETARNYGLGEVTGIDLPGEKSGLVPDREWKEKNFNEGWYPGDSVNLSIGQGGLLTTPIQLIDMVSAIANDGIMYRPYLVDRVIDNEGNLIFEQKPDIRKKLDFDPEVYQILKQGMTEVTTSSYGTARSIFGDFPVRVAGKTGTAQTSISNANHGWFVGFAPIEDPQIVVLVFIENGNSSSNTLSVAAEIFKKYFGIDEEDTSKQKENLITKEEFLNPKNRLFEFLQDVFSGGE